MLKKYKFQLSIIAIILVLTTILIVYVLSGGFNNDTRHSDVPADTVILSSGDATMSFDEAFFLTKNTQAYYEAIYLSNDSKIDWNADTSNGTTNEAVVLEESLNYIKQIFLFSEYAKSQGMTLTEKELDAVNEEVQLFLSDSTKKVIDAAGASEDVLTRVYTREAYYDKVCQQIYGTLNSNNTDDERRTCRVAAIEISPQYFDSPDRTAKKIMEKVNSGEIITKVASIYGTEALEGSVSKGDMDGNSLEELCLSLKDGECKMTQIDDTYFVVYCYMAYDAQATQQTAVQAFYDELSNKMPITLNEDIWSTVNFDTAIFTDEDATTATTTAQEILDK